MKENQECARFKFIAIWTFLILIGFEKNGKPSAAAEAGIWGATPMS